MLTCSLKRFTIFIFTLTFFSCTEKTLFLKIDPKVSNVHFSNRITEKDSLNIIDFEYVYNGAGVGVGDFNNDGQKDLFFTGNQVENKLYLNQGNFKFKDVSQEANLKNSGRWCAGAVVVDINADGLMDIYVAATVNKKPEARENLLYVNQGIKNGIPSFKEMAAEYGINDNGHSENATFFDYDNDGDLDLYVLTNIINQYPNQFREKQRDGSNPNTDRLYQCNWDEKLGHPIYTNVSKEAGILIEGFGLGMNVCDINQDGWKDIYISNDYLSDDLLYINNTDGTFTDMAQKYFKHTSISAMGNDVADINNDGFLDIVTMDMLAKTNERKKKLTGPNSYQNFTFLEQYGFTYQYMRNTLQLNNGITRNESPMFSEISLMAGVAETDWSWTPSLADFDNDGYRDLLITNGFPKDITDRDFATFRAEAERYASKEMMLEQIPVIKISNFAFKNIGKLGFEDKTKDWGLDIPSFSNGAVYADLDNDGDLDYVVNNINDSAFVYQNTLETQTEKKNFLNLSFIGDKKNINGIGAVAKVYFEDGEVQIHENNPFRGYLSTVEQGIHVGVGDKKVRMVKVEWYNGQSQTIKNPKLNESLVFDIKNSSKIKEINLPAVETPIFTEVIFKDSLFNHKEVDFIDFNMQNTLPFKLSQLGPGVSVGDINGDKILDAYMPGAKGIAGTFLIQNTLGDFEKRNLDNNITLDQKQEELSSLLIDLDGDSDLDLYQCIGGNEVFKEPKSLADKVFLNNGKGNFTEGKNIIPTIDESTSCARAFDFDQDGDLDIITAGRNVAGKYPLFASSHLLRNDSKPGKPTFTEVKNIFSNIGLVCDILCTDVNNDGQTDILMASEWSDIKVFINQKGSFQLQKNTGLENLKGLWTSLNGGDFDHDGDIDYIAGNIGENTLLKGSEKKPVEMFAKDFDKNGVYDAIPFVYFRNEEGNDIQVPFNGKDDINKQLNVTRTRFTDYKGFATATIENLLTKEEKKDAQHLHLNYNSSVYIENLGGGKFKANPLPRIAQVSTVYGILINDFNADGHLDVLTSGNNYGNEISSGRYDASNGVLLLGNGKGEFKPQSTDFYLPYDAKATAFISNPNGDAMILGTQNRNALKLFKSQLKVFPNIISSKNKGYTYSLNGKKTKMEFYYGSGYLAQSAIACIAPKNIQNLNLY
jgi:enediyne biosynthesis protein E4